MNLWNNTSGPVMERLIAYHTARAEKHPDDDRGRWSANEAEQLQRFRSAEQRR